MTRKYPSSSPLELLGLCKLVLQHWARESEWRVAKRIDSHVACLERVFLKSSHGHMSLKPVEWKYLRLASLAEEAGVLRILSWCVGFFVEVCWGIFSPKKSLPCGNSNTVSVFQAQPSALVQGQEAEIETSRGGPKKPCTTGSRLLHHR